MRAPRSLPTGTTTSTVAAVAAGFAAELEAIAQEVSAAFARALAACRVEDRGTTVGPALKPDKSLVWHIASLATSVHPGDVVEHLPSQEGVALVTSAMVRHGVPGLLTSKLQAATARFEAFLGAGRGRPARRRRPAAWVKAVSSSAGLL